MTGQDKFAANEGLKLADSTVFNSFNIKGLRVKVLFKQLTFCSEEFV